MSEEKVFIGLLNPKSPHNVSSVRRAAGNFRVESIYYTGSRYPRALALNPDLPKMSRSVSDEIPVIQVENLLAEVPDDMQIVCVEFALNASSLLSFKHPDKAIYLFGPEDGTLSQAIINKAHAVVYVPTEGCMNLAATANVVLYDRLSKSGLDFNDEQMIRKSRDRNNNIKVKKPFKS